MVSGVDKRLSTPEWGVCKKVILVLRHMSLVLTNICQQFQHQDHFFADPPFWCSQMLVNTRMDPLY